MTDWNHTRRIKEYNLNGITILDQVRGGSVLILTQAFSFKYKEFFGFLSLSLSLSSMPPFSREPFPYIVMFFSIPAFHLLTM